PFTPGQHSVLTDDRIVAAGQTQDPLVDLGVPRRLLDEGGRGTRACQRDVVGNGVAEELSLLENETDVGIEHVVGHLPDIHTIDPDTSLGDVMEASREACECGFPGSRRPYQSGNS